MASGVFHFWSYDLSLTTAYNFGLNFETVHFVYSRHGHLKFVYRRKLARA